jgi:hypothetical protein
VQPPSLVSLMPVADDRMDPGDPADRLHDDHPVITERTAGEAAAAADSRFDHDCRAWLLAHGEMYDTFDEPHAGWRLHTAACGLDPARTGRVHAGWGDRLPDREGVTCVTTCACGLIADAVLASREARLGTLLTTVGAFADQRDEPTWERPLSWTDFIASGAPVAATEGSRWHVPTPDGEHLQLRCVRGEGPWRGMAGLEVPGLPTRPAAWALVRTMFGEPQPGRRPPVAA